MNEPLIWACTAIVLAAIVVGGPVSCVMSNARTVERMVQQGADPIAASCSVALDRSAAACIVSATKPR